MLSFFSRLRGTSYELAPTTEISAAFPQFEWNYGFWISLSVVAFLPAFLSIIIAYELSIIFGNLVWFFQFLSICCYVILSVFFLFKFNLLKRPFFPCSSKTFGFLAWFITIIWLILLIIIIQDWCFEKGQYLLHRQQYGEVEARVLAAISSKLIAANVLKFPHIIPKFMESVIKTEGWYYVAPLFDADMHWPDESEGPVDVGLFVSCFCARHINGKTRTYEDCRRMCFYHFLEGYGFVTTLGEDMLYGTIPVHYGMPNQCEDVEFHNSTSLRNVAYPHPSYYRVPCDFTHFYEAKEKINIYKRMNSDYAHPPVYPFVILEWKPESEYWQRWGDAERAFNAASLTWFVVGWFAVLPGFYFVILLFDACYLKETKKRFN